MSSHFWKYAFVISEAAFVYCVGVYVWCVSRSVVSDSLQSHAL